MRDRKMNNEVASAKKIIVATKPHSPVSEQFRTIRTNIMYSSIDRPIRSVLFTSAVAGAGKSTIAANVAIAYAQAGKKTLLLDGDLRRPTCHYTFKVSNQKGLSTAIVNDIAFEELVNQTEFDDLHLITSGPIPPNPSELLSSKKLTQFIDHLKFQYEMIIVDSPPLLSVTDAQLLSKSADGVIMIADVENNNRNHLLEAKDLLNKADANIIGLVLNNRDIKYKSKEDYYYYQASHDG